jgi:hypothetical protein
MPSLTRPLTYVDASSPQLNRICPSFARRRVNYVGMLRVHQLPSLSVYYRTRLEII